MKNTDINICDLFDLYEDESCYMHGTRAESFGKKTGGFDVYISIHYDETTLDYHAHADGETLILKNTFSAYRFFGALKFLLILF